MVAENGIGGGGMPVERVCAENGMDCNGIRAEAIGGGFGWGEKDAPKAVRVVGVTNVLGVIIVVV